MRSVLVLITVFVLLAGLGPMLAPYDPTAINIPKRLSGQAKSFCWAPMLWAAISCPASCTARVGPLGSRS